MRRLVATTLGTMAEDWERHGPGVMFAWALYAMVGLFMVTVVVGTAIALLLVLTGN